MKKWQSILIVLICIAAIVTITVNCLQGRTVGRCLIADNGSVILIAGTESIVLCAKNPDSPMLKNLQTGDKILVFHDGVRESYPAQTLAYFVVKLGSGTEADIPASVISQLAELGWISMENGYAITEAEFILPCDCV